MCEIPGCGRKHCSKGLCQKHYDAQPEQKAKRKRYFKTPAGKASRRKTDARRYREMPDKIKGWSREYKLKHTYKTAKAAAERRTRGCKEFLLTEIEWEHLRAMPCYYCGGPLPPLGLGLDRNDCDKPYVLGNVVPCCKFCNILRNRLMSVDETYMVVQFLKKLRRRQDLWTGYKTL